MKTIVSTTCEEVKLRVYVHADCGSESCFKVSINGSSVTVNCKPIEIEDNSVISLSLESFLTVLVEESDWIRAAIPSFKSKFNPKFPRFCIIDENSRSYRVSSLEDYPSGRYGEIPLESFREIRLTDSLQVGKQLKIDYYTFIAMIVGIYDKLENDKAPVDIDDDIEDHDNYFKAYSNTKFTKESLRKLLEMSGADPTASED